uniref:Tc1-like transposase DDE domain-containing protein n=1 Tax=Glossina morsitans morsitans TaxID=37546 RepID=A0A1B0FNC6_GLOMM
MIRYTSRSWSGPIESARHGYARPHTVAVMRQYLEKLDVSVTMWPARSPDSIPIEHLWEEPKKTSKNRNRTPTSLGELRTAIKEEWDRFFNLDAYEKRRNER